MKAANTKKEKMGKGGGDRACDLGVNATLRVFQRDLRVNEIMC